MNSEEIFNNIKNNTRTTVTKEFDPQEILKNIEADKTKDVDVNVTDQKSVPQYVDVDKVPEQKFVQPERRSYFVAGNANNNEINTTAQRPNEIEYEADTVDDEKKKDNYFGLSKLKTNKRDIVKNALKYVVQAPNLIQNAANTIGMFTGKSGEDVIKEGVRGFAGSTVDFASSMARFFGQNYMYFKAYKDEQLNKITNLGNVVAGGEDFTPEIKQKYTDFYKRIDEQTKEFKDKTERFLQYTGIAKTDKDGFIYDLVGGASSLMYAIGLSVITKSPVAAAEAFGAYQYQSLYEEGIEKGFSPIKARSIGVAGGAAEGALELVGLHVLIETLAARKSFAKILKSAATEFIQEASQQGAEEILATTSGMRTESVSEILANVGYAGLIGALIGGGTAGISNTRFVQKMISDSATKELINKGVNSEYAKQMVDKMLEFSVSPQMTDEVVGMIKDEESPVTYKNADPRETYKETGEAIKKALDPAQKRGVELEFIDEKKKFTDTVANALINSGRFTQEEAYKQAEAQANLADGLARIGFEQDNIRPSEYYKRFKVDVTSGNIETDERNVDEENPFVDVSFDPVDFDPQARAEYEAAMDAQQEEIDKLQKEFTMSLKDHAKFFSELGIEAIRRPTPDGVGKDRWGEYKDLSPRIKNYFFSDDATMSWDDAEKLLAESSSNIKDLFEYLTKADETAKTYNQKEIFNKVLAKEKEAIKQQAIADGTFLKAPNGKDSNLPEQLWLTVRTKAFKNWFGDWLNDPTNASKVVDENGEPLVVYHGTSNNFRVFKRNVNYFTDNKDVANTYTGTRKVYEVFANIRNPITVNANKEKWSMIDISNISIDGVDNIEDFLKQNGASVWKEKGTLRTTPADILSAIEDNLKNNDGVIIKDIYDEGGYSAAAKTNLGNDYVVFDSKQVKSINNRGRFDPRNANIYLQSGIQESTTEQKTKEKFNIILNTAVKDLVETRTVKEIQDKLQKMFGTYEELDAYHDGEDNGVDKYIAVLANEYMAELEYAARERDYDVTENLLNRLKKDVVEISERKNYNNVDEKQKENNLSDTSRSSVLRTEKSAEGNLYLNPAKTDLQVANLSIEQLKEINDNIVFTLLVDKDHSNMDYFESFNPETVKFVKANGIKNFDKNGVYVKGKKKAADDLLMTETDKKFHYAEGIEDVIGSYENLGKTKEAEYYKKLLSKFLKLQDELIQVQEKLRAYIAKNNPKQAPQQQSQQSQIQLQADIQQPMLDIFWQQKNEPRGATTVFDRQYFINLFSTADKSTLMHEMAHAWLSEINYFASAKNATAKVLDIKKQLDNWLGVPDNNGRYSTEQQEQFAQNFEVYLKEGKAPTAKLKTVFARFKTWLSEIYDRIKDDLPKINDDVRELFDSILSRSYDVPDSNIYAGKEKAIKEVIKNIQEGKASEVDGITIDDVYNLLNMAYTRKPRKPSKNLKQLLNDKNIYDFNELNKAGADTVLQILKDSRYVKADATAEQAIELAKTALDGNPVYRLSDQWRVAGDIDFARNLRVLEKVIEFSQIDSTLEKILSLQQEGYRNVEQSDVDKVQDEYKRLMSADVKEAKKIVEDIINRLHKKRFIDRAAQKQMIVDLNFSSTVEEIRESVLNVIEDLQDEIKLVKEQLRNPRKPVVRKDKTIPPGKNATEEEKNTYKKYMRKQINRLLKQVLPSKRGNNKVSKFGNVNVERFFTKMIEINKLSREEAEKEFIQKKANLAEMVEQDQKGKGLDNMIKIENMFYGYKANIITSNSCEFLKRLYDSLQKINIAGRTEKQINDYLTNEKKQQDIDELKNAIDKNKSKNVLSKMFKWFYNYSVGNWYSFVNSVAGKQQAEKYALEVLEAKVMVKAKQVCDRIRDRSMAVLGVRGKWYANKINEYSKEKYVFVENDIDNRGHEIKRKRELNRMQLICCYIWSKNKQLKERIIRAFGNEQFNEMMAKLDQQDILWGDIIQEETASLYDEINEVYIDLYGIDLGQQENYFPSITERVENSSDIDLLKDFIVNCSNPGFIKSRTESNLIRMKFTNPIAIAENHILKAAKFAVMQKKLSEIYKVFKHHDIEAKLNEIYGEGKYTLFKYMNKMLDNIKFTNFERQIDIVHAIGDFLTNNYILTRIAFKPSIVVKQLLSFTNYMEDVDVDLWIKHFGKMVANPTQLKQIVNFMFKNSPYLKARFESGAINEALEKTLEGQPNTVLYLRSLKGFLSIATRLGDIGAIIFGGYPMIQAQLEKGVPIEKAFENFEKATLRSQQANFSSTLSNWQHNFKQNPLLRAIFAFGNTPAQYSRKIVDVIYAMAHGDEKFLKGKGFKTLMLYGVEQSFVYTAFTSLAILSGWFNDDWDDFKDDIWLSLLQVSNFLGFPFVGQLYQTLVNTVVTGEPLPDKRLPILQDYTDFTKALKKANDEGWGDLDVRDWIKLIDKASAVTAGIPIETLYNTWISSWADIINGDYGKGFVKLYGATESRANKIFD